MGEKQGLAKFSSHPPCSFPKYEAACQQRRQLTCKLPRCYVRAEGCSCPGVGQKLPCKSLEGPGRRGRFCIPTPRRLRLGNSDSGLHSETLSQNKIKWKKDQNKLEEDFLWWAKQRNSATLKALCVPLPVPKQQLRAVQARQVAVLTAAWKLCLRSSGWAASWGWAISLRTHFLSCGEKVASGGFGDFIIESGREEGNTSLLAFLGRLLLQNRLRWLCLTSSQSSWLQGGNVLMGQSSVFWNGGSWLLQNTVGFWAETKKEKAGTQAMEATNQCASVAWWGP